MRLNTNHQSNSPPSLKLVAEKLCTAAPVTVKATDLPLSRDVIYSTEIVDRGKPDWNVAAILCGDGSRGRSTYSLATPPKFGVCANIVA